MREFWRREPSLIIGLIQAAFVVAVSFGLSLTAEQVGAITALMAALFAVLTRQNVGSKATLDTLAKGTLQSKPTPSQQAKAAQVLGIENPGQVIPPDLLKRAESVLELLPAPISMIVKLVGVDGLRIAVETALAKVPSQSETDTRATEGL